ncbi:(2Fe-2S)-binding protein [Thalassospira mesophila]|uniref:(2Fe-2S)-binding protein n=1 Tax=Thalassospira mesophila TaxID=1293891 RepID=UPI000A1DF996|nr:(2Fe-2S)-binding protein [Thalassospira mesophila]
MFVCVCNALNQGDVKRAATQGNATRPAEVFRFHGCKPQCGKCACHMRAELNQHCCFGEHGQDRVVANVAADQAIAAE